MIWLCATEAKLSKSFNSKCIDICRLSSHLLIDNKNSITYLDIIDKLCYLDIKREKNIKRIIDSIIKNMFHVTPKRDENGKRFFYNNLRLIELSVTPQEMVSDLKTRYPNVSIHIEKSDNHNVNLTVLPEGGGSRVISIDDSQRLITVRTTGGIELPHLNGTYNGDVSFCCHIHYIITAASCSMKTATSCLTIFRISNERSGPIACSSCRHHSRYEKQILKERTVKETEARLSSGLAEVSKEFLDHVNNQVQNKKKGQPVYNSRYKQAYYYVTINCIVQIVELTNKANCSNRSFSDVCMTLLSSALLNIITLFYTLS